MDKSTSSSENSCTDREQVSRAWGIVLFGLIGASAAILAVGQVRKTADWFYTQFNRSQSTSSWRNTASGSSHGTQSQEAWNRYNRRIQEEYEEELERVERIRRMQRVFNRERERYRWGYERWRENNSSAYQHFPRDDWYWKTDTSYQYQSTDYGSMPKDCGSYSMSHHYSILGLDRSRKMPYSDSEIKAAFRAKAMEHHPDQNQNNKEAAEAKFKEVMASYEAIKLERKTRC